MDSSSVRCSDDSPLVTARIARAVSSSCQPLVVGEFIEVFLAGEETFFAGVRGASDASLASYESSTAALSTVLLSFCSSTRGRGARTCNENEINLIQMESVQSARECDRGRPQMGLLRGAA